MKYLIIPALALSLSSCYMVRAYNNRKLTLTSHAQLPFTVIKKGDSSYHFPEALSGAGYQSLKDTLDKNLSGTETAAFIIIKNDSIIYERYFNGFDKHSLLPSFSVVKSFVGTLTGICFEEGKIKSLQEPMTNYLPEFLQKDERFKYITIQHLLDMRSGLNWNEGEYGLKDDAIKMAFRPNVTPYVYKVQVKETPGRQEYQSINTLLLAMIVEKATGVSISQYLQQKLWIPLGMETGATWTTDKHKREIAYAGLNATARDFAKFGSLFLHKGNWQGKQIISEQWICRTSFPDSMMKYEGYRNQFWGTQGYKLFNDSLSAAETIHSIKGNHGLVRSYSLKGEHTAYYVTYTSASYYAQGILGQYIYINPENNTIIVRLGHYWKYRGKSLNNFIKEVSEQL